MGDLKGKKIVLTGGCGFVGVNLIQYLLKKDDILIKIIDNLSVGSKKDIKRVTEFSELSGDKSVSKWPSGVSLVVGDILNGELAKDICQGADIIIHLAANTGVIPSIEDPVGDMSSNVIGIVNYLEAARANRIGKFVFASSGAPLGEQEPPINEQCVPRPLSPYGASKLAGEGYCIAYYGSFDVSTIVLRFGNVYGPNSSHKGSVVAKFIKNIIDKNPLVIYGDGNQTRDFIFTGDLTDAICRAAITDHGGEIFQIATYRETTVNEIADILSKLSQKVLGYSPTIIYEDERKGEIKRNYSDISKAKKMLVYDPDYDIERGLEVTFQWFLEQK